MAKRNQGFTLIEVAILLVIIGLVATGGLSIIGTVAEAGRSTVTVERIAQVEQALQSYVEVNGCLPCPANGATASTAATAGHSADTAGGEYAPAAVCTADPCITADAVVPWKTLGISEEQAIDGWSNRIRYYVEGDECASCTALAGVQDFLGMNRSGTSYPAGLITMEDNDSVFADQTNVVYVVVSSGPDQARGRKYRTGVLTSDRWTQTGGGGGQEENFDDATDSTFSYGDRNDTTGTAHFDDIVSFTTAPVVVQKCGPGACGNPS